MKQSATQRPDPTFFRKAAIAHGAALDHAGKVRVAPIEGFSLDRTIFKTLEGVPARYVMRKRVGQEVYWASDAAAEVQRAYDDVMESLELPEVPAELMQFLVDECDFDVEHADGSFLDHLYFCFEYTAKHWPEGSALVMLLHSILGTGTNTFAMTADKIPQLKALLSEEDWIQTEAFPSVLRLLYAGPLREELSANVHRADSLDSITMHRVIDNASITLSGSAFWDALNYQLIHLVDFLPVANWTSHQNDTSFILFRELFDLLSRADKRVAGVEYSPATGPRRHVGESPSLGARLIDRIPVKVSDAMARRSVTTFSERIGHSLDYRIRWS